MWVGGLDDWVNVTTKISEGRRENDSYLVVIRIVSGWEIEM